MLRPSCKTLVGAASVASTLLVWALLTRPAIGDEPSRLGRFFRFGQPLSPTVPHVEESRDTPRNVTRTVEPTIIAPLSNSPQPRIIPQPRNARAVTEADPIVTRISLGRSDDGTQFGMFLQVFADGTVIDTEGVHPLGRKAVKGVFEALEEGELYRIKGHCGSPSTDFIEQVHMVVYERSMRGLRANAFSFSGNSQGCDHAVQRLQKALDSLQTKLTRNVPEAKSPSNSGIAPRSNIVPLEPVSNSPPIFLNAVPRGEI